ncbi:hypothetical protein HDV06_001713 [Boothiomyces sp. JEL0866]|nr:hypothetical protein HDV06_001713 [Boothiomyces sp. JEL0866]
MNGGGSSAFGPPAKVYVDLDVQLQNLDAYIRQYSKGGPDWDYLSEVARKVHTFKEDSRFGQSMYGAGPKALAHTIGSLVAGVVEDGRTISPRDIGNTIESIVKTSWGFALQ